MEEGVGNVVNEASVILYGYRTREGLLGTHTYYDSLAEHTTDENGNIYIDFNHNHYPRADAYCLQASKNGYYKTGRIENTFEKRENNTLTIVMQAEATLQVCVRNINPYDSLDVISICNFNATNEDYRKESYIGKSVDECITDQTIANYPYSFCYTVTKNNVSNEYFQDVHALPGLNEITIEY